MVLANSLPFRGLDEGNSYLMFKGNAFLVRKGSIVRALVSKSA